MFNKKATMKTWDKMIDKFSAENLKVKQYDKNKDRFKRKKKDDGEESRTEKIFLVIFIFVGFFVLGSFMFSEDDGYSSTTHFIHK